MIIKEQKPLEFINDARCQVDEYQLAEAMHWYNLVRCDGSPMYHRKKIFMHGKYAGVSIHKYKVHVHRLLMMYIHEALIPRHYHIHHINGDKLDNRRKNLVLITASEHMQLTNKGRRFTDEHKAALSKANQQRKGIKIKKRRPDVSAVKVGEFLGLGWSINKIANHFECDWSTIRNRIHENPELLA